MYYAYSTSIIQKSAVNKLVNREFGRDKQNTYLLN